LPIKEKSFMTNLNLNLPANELSSQPLMDQDPLRLALGSLSSRSIPCSLGRKSGEPTFTPFGLGLSVASSSPCKPSEHLHCSSPTTAPAAAALAQSAMANFPVDPTPFIPGQFEILEVANRPQQWRYHVSGRASAKHEDLAIATITHALPANQPFAATKFLLRSFIEDELRIPLGITQRCPIGTAYVRVNEDSYRDWLVQNSPHHFEGREISFVEHNRGINHSLFHLQS
jgi:hypothetical protein